MEFTSLQIDSTFAAVDSSARTIDVYAVDAGRNYTFALREAGAPAAFDCSSLPASARIVANRLSIEIGIRAASGTLSVVCASDAGSFEVRFHHSASKLAIVGSTLREVEEATWAPYGYTISSNGRFVGFGTYTYGGTGSLALVKDRVAQKMIVASRSATGVISDGYADEVNVTPDGRYVVFHGDSTNLLPGLTGSTQVFLKDLVSGAVELISSTDGTVANQSNNTSDRPKISDNGRYVFFRSRATNLVAGVPAGIYQIYRKDRVLNTVELVTSSTGLGANATPGNVGTYEVSADGRFVIVTANGSGWLAGATGQHAWRIDLQTPRVITLASSVDGTAANRATTGASAESISADGRYAAFTSSSANLFPGITGTQLFRKDFDTGTILLASSRDGTAGTRSVAGVQQGSMSADGQIFTFSAGGANGFVTPAAPFTQVFYRNLTNDSFGIVSSPDGTAANAGDDFHYDADLSRDGSAILFFTYAGSYLDTANSDSDKIYVKQLDTGRIELGNGITPAAAYMSNDTTRLGTLTRDGSGIIFECMSYNLFPRVTTWTHACYKEFATGEITLLDSVDGAGVVEGNNHAYRPTISSDGRYAAYDSTATNLLGAQGASSGRQIFMNDRESGQIRIVSSLDATPANRGNGVSDSARIAGTGRYVVFTSSATNLVAGTTLAQIFRKDLQTEAIVLVSSTDGTAGNRGNAFAGSPAVSDDGRYVVFTSAATNLVAGTTLTQVFRKDLVSQAILLVSSIDGTVGNRSDGNCSAPQISANGRYVAFLCTSTNLVAGIAGTQLYLRDLDLNTIELLSSTDGLPSGSANANIMGFRMSSDARYFVLHSAATNLFPGTSGTQVFRLDRAGNDWSLVSSRSSAFDSESGNCSNGTISDDGRWAAFETYSPSLFPLTAGSLLLLRDMN